MNLLTFFSILSIYNTHIVTFFHLIWNLSKFSILFAVSKVFTHAVYLKQCMCIYEKEFEFFQEEMVNQIFM